MRKLNFALLLLIISINFSCKRNDVKEAFQCTSEYSFFNSNKTYQDVLKHFKIDIPQEWKTELYYDEFQSEIYSADTTKQLTESFIIDITWHQGELNFNRNFKRKVKKNLVEENLKTIRSGKGKFNDLPVYYNIAKGKYLSYEYHLLQLYVKSNVDEYYTFTSKVYGSESIDERICASVNLFEDIEFLDD
ncbi:MAG: hypothetical protein ABFR05_11950 [Bacteroidota bacterium]